MGEQPTYEDLVRAIARRRVLVAACIVALALLGAWYGRQTTSGGNFEAEATINIVQSNVILPENVSAPVELRASVEAARFAADIRTFAGELHESVTVKADVAGNAIIVSAEGETAAEAEELAVSSGTAFVEARRAVDRARYSEQAAFEQQQLTQLGERLDQVNTELSASSGSSLTLEGERIQLFDRLLQASERANAATTNAEQYDSGLTDPVIVEPAAPSSSSGWVVFGLIGALLGAMAGIGLALLLNSVDHRIRSRADVERIAGGVPILGVFGRRGADPDELAALQARLAARRDPTAVAGVSDADPSELPSDLGAALQSEDGLTIRRGTGALTEGQAVVLTRGGRTTDAQLATILADLDARRVNVLGVVLWDVPAAELEWARRPLLAQT
ncbi:MAG: hypothetical protein AB7J47_01300 [Acidimicrobiia bacterium]